jgi:hypothetical protein
MTVQLSRRSAQQSHSNFIVSKLSYGFRSYRSKNVSTEIVENVTLACIGPSSQWKPTPSRRHGPTDAQRLPGSRRHDRTNRRILGSQSFLPHRWFPQAMPSDHGEARRLRHKNAGAGRDVSRRARRPRGLWLWRECPEREMGAVPLDWIPSV